MTGTTVAVFGGGRMGEALLAGLRRAGHAAPDLRVAERDAERAEQLRSAHRIEAVGPRAACAAAQVLVLATKPHDLDELLGEIAAHLHGGHLVLSVAAGVGTARIEAALPEGSAVVRAMPNTPALVGVGMTAVAAGAHADEGHLALAEDVLGAVGRVVRVPESQLDAVTAVSGSGPAYFFHAVESMVEAGVLLGLPRRLATELVVQTALGSATMLDTSGEHPTQLREAVTSPGGTTAAALAELEIHGVRAAYLAAITAAAARSRELGSSK